MSGDGTRGRTLAKREKRRADIVAKIKGAGHAPAVEAVRPLNPGFFMLERIRVNAVTAAKKRAKVRKQPEGK